MRPSASRQALDDVGVSSAEVRLIVGGLVETSAVVNWTPLRVALTGVENSVTFGWADLDSLVGGLPRSAYAHSAFWKGARSGWPDHRGRGLPDLRRLDRGVGRL